METAERKTSSKALIPTSNSAVQSATNCALSNWIILERIFDMISADEAFSCETCPVKGTDADSMKDDPESHWCRDCSYYHCRGVLLRCSLVNRFWFQEATKILWKRPYTFLHDHGTTLTSLLGWPEGGERRQYYAGLIEEGTERTAEERRRRRVLDTRYGSIETLSFPKMKTLYMSLDLDGHVPQMRGAAVERLVLDPHYESCNPETWFVDQDTLETILDELAVTFPNVKEIEFIDRALAWPGSLQRFAKRMSRLETFDHDMVLETSQACEFGSLV